MPDEKSARRRHQVIDKFIQNLELGKREIPEGVDVADFIFAAGATPAKPLPVAEAAKEKRPTLGDLWRLYSERSAGRSKESTTRETEGYHEAHPLRVLGENFRLDGLDLSVVQEYARKPGMRGWGEDRDGPFTSD